MSGSNPTVPINVTAKELRVLSGLLGYDTHCITLRDKLSAADDAMRLATRQKNREAKAARKARKETA